MNENRWPTWDEWLQDLPEADRLKALSLQNLFELGGADDPGGWARSEVAENIAQAARFSFLRAVWRQIERYRDPETVQRMVPDLDAAGLEIAMKVAGQVAFDMAFSVASVLDDEEDIDGEEGFPGWRLMELGDDDELTGRDVGGLHESVLEVDPLGIEAADIRGF